eukprot:654045-Pleurochrysis_carterae.AAC.2
MSRTEARALRPINRALEHSTDERVEAHLRKAERERAEQRLRLHRTLLVQKDVVLGAERDVAQPEKSVARLPIPASVSSGTRRSGTAAAKPTNRLHWRPRGRRPAHQREAAVRGAPLRVHRTRVGHLVERRQQRSAHGPRSGADGHPEVARREPALADKGASARERELCREVARHAERQERICMRRSKHKRPANLGR